MQKYLIKQIREAKEKVQKRGFYDRLLLQREVSEIDIDYITLLHNSMPEILDRLEEAEKDIANLGTALDTMTRRAKAGEELATALMIRSNGWVKDLLDTYNKAVSK